MTNIKIILSQFLLLVFFVPVANCELPKESEQQVVAEVNGVKISKDELESELRSNLKDEVDSFEEAQKHVLLRAMLKTMVERTLLLQKAKSTGVVPGEKEVQRFVKSINAKLPEEENFESQLKEFGVSKSAYLKRLQEELGIKRYLDEKLFEDLEVTEEELNTFFLKNSKDYAVPMQACARHIFIEIPEDAGEVVATEKKKKAIEIRSMLLDKKNDFATIARRFSEASNRGKGGDLGCFTKNQLPSHFSDRAFALKPKEISEVIRTPEGFHIIKVSRLKGGETPELKEVEQRVKDRVLRLKRENILNQHLKKLTEAGKVIIYYN